MLQIETRPIREDELEGGKLSQYIFFRGTTIVAFVAADCCVCAWKEGKTKFPGTTMAYTWSPIESMDLASSMCIIERNRRRQDYKK